MGLLQGRVCDNTFIVSDVFGLPVEGTETRVCAGNDANVYINDYVENMESVRRKENQCGWYHSHPDYGPWLSGIDVST